MKGKRPKIMDWKPPETFAEGAREREGIRQALEEGRRRHKRTTDRAYEGIMSLAGAGRGK
jgi:hypothetical protein